MASFDELIKLNSEGSLGELLVRTFNGEIGRLDSRKDAEFMVGFASKQLTPTVDQIEKAVTDYYWSHGYTLDLSINRSQNCFQALVFFGTRDLGCVHVVITTFYPLVIGDEHNHLRVTTTVFD